MDLIFPEDIGELAAEVIHAKVMPGQQLAPFGAYKEALVRLKAGRSDITFHKEIYEKQELIVPFFDSGGTAASRPLRGACRAGAYHTGFIHYLVGLLDCFSVFKEKLAQFSI